MEKCVYMCPKCGKYMLCDAIVNNAVLTCPCGERYVRSKNFEEGSIPDWSLFIEGFFQSIKPSNSNGDIHPCRVSAPAIVAQNSAGRKPLTGKNKKPPKAKIEAPAFPAFTCKRITFKTFIPCLLQMIFAAAIGPGWIIYFVVNWLCIQVGANAPLSASISYVVVAVAIMCAATVIFIDSINKELENMRDEAVNRALQIWASDYKAKIQTLNSEQSQKYPWMAQQYADLQYVFDEQIAYSLGHKKRPAYKAAEEISEMAKSKREITIKAKSLEYQLEFLESTYPWLKSLEEIHPKAAFEDAMNIDNGYDNSRMWLSPTEYAKLTDVKKNQLALDRYMKRSRNSWEAGRDYERYIGYCYERNGYIVDYIGATAEKEDRGIDLIAKKNGEIIIIQCKRYNPAASKFVHENTVAQLYGVSAVYKMENGNCDVIPMIYTSSTLSEEAIHFAEYLQIMVIENFRLTDYPIIKCNTSKSKEKIYHLPFDQQYDRMHIGGRNNAFYASTVQEAESKGFRRAYRWHPDRA